MSTEITMYTSEFARYIGQKVEHRVEQRIEQETLARVMLTLLATRFGELSPTVTEEVRRASVETLNAVTERFVKAETLEHAISPLRA